MGTVANDYRLKIKPEIPQPTSYARWVSQEYGGLPFPYEIDENSITGTKNSCSMRIRISAAYLHDAIPLIIGYAERNGVAIPPPTGTALHRVLPMAVPMDRSATLTIDTTKFWGMRAVSLSWTLEGKTGVHGESWQAGGNPPSPWTANDFLDLPTGYDKITDFNPNLRMVKTSGDHPYGNPPRSPDEPIARYEYAVLSVTFAHLPYDVASDATVASSVYGEKDRYTTGTWSPSYEYNTFRKGQLKWNSGPNKNNQVGPEALGGLLVSTGTVQLTWYRVPGASAINQTDAIKDCLDQIELYLGHCNGTPWAIPIFKNFRTYPAETLMMIPQSTPPVIELGPSGFIEANITFNFLYREQGWNKLMHPNGNFYEVIMANGKFPYPLDTDVTFNGFDDLFLG